MASPSFTILYKQRNKWHELCEHDSQEQQLFVDWTWQAGDQISWTSMIVINQKLNKLDEFLVNKPICSYIDLHLE